MERSEQRILATSIAVFSVAGAVLAVLFTTFVDFAGEPAPAEPAQNGRGNGAYIIYAPPALDAAPEHLREAVKLGFAIINETHKYAGQYTGNKLECRNCHFNGGITQGGRNGGFSLVGVGATYPKYRSRQQFAVDLVDRTSDCFERSLNGKAPPPNGREMQALMAYYQWISRDLPIYGDVPWLGSKPLKQAKSGDPTAGSAVYDKQCAMCHGAWGEGTPIAPPLWGAESFNDGAGMHRPETFASFTYCNMPRGNPELQEQQAADVAAYVASKTRPHFTAEQR